MSRKSNSVPIGRFGGILDDYSTAESNDGVYTKPQEYDKTYRGAMRRYKMVNGKECIEDSKGNWTPIVLTASVGQMPSIMGTADDAIKIRKRAIRDSLEGELQNAGYYDLTLDSVVTLSGSEEQKGQQMKSLSGDVKYQLLDKKRKIHWKCQEKVKPIGDKAVKEWTQMQLDNYLSGEKEIASREYSLTEDDVFKEDDSGDGGANA